MQQWINGVLHDLSKQATWSIDWQVDIGGKDRTGILRPYLIRFIHRSTSDSVEKTNC